MKRLAGGIVLLFSAFVLLRSGARGWRARQSAVRRRDVALQEWPFVSVIVPAWREQGTLETCLSSLRQVDYPSYEVIVVAGGPDGTLDTATEAARSDSRLRVIPQLPRGKNAALNQGLAAACADVLVFLDADSVLDPGWLQALVAALRGDVAATTGNYFPLRITPISLAGELAKVLEYEVRGRVILQGSGGIAVRREALETIGPFPEERISSDWDLDARLGLRGYRKEFAHDALIRSHRPATLREWWVNELRWRRLHLLTLFRLRGGLLAEPAVTARHLYPYVIAWSIAVLTAASLAALAFGSKMARRLWLTLWSGVVTVSLVRDLASVVEVLAYRPDARWLRAGVVVPLLTVAGWAACCVASLTPSKARAQFKGPR